MFAMGPNSSPFDTGGHQRALDRLRDRLGQGPVDEGEQPLFHHIAAQIIARRQDLRLSQAELAALCDTTQSAIARIERGSRPPRIDTLLRIAGALDCDLRIDLQPRTRRKEVSP